MSAVTAVPVDELQKLVRVLTSLADQFTELAEGNPKYSVPWSSDLGRAAGYRFAADNLQKLCDDGVF